MLNPAAQFKTADGSHTRFSAIRTAWIVWLTLLVVPFFYTLFIAWQILLHSASSRSDGMNWFVVAMVYLLAMVPLSFFWRSQLFKSYWSGVPVDPAKYLWGSIAVWAALEIGGLFSLSGCLVYQSLLPNLMPALIAFMFFVILFPDGRAMTHRTGDSQDPAVYEEPK